jgi:hypothetical protein
MTNLPLAYILSDGATSLEVNSARPDAPVVPERVRVARTRRSRIALAGLLERAAATVAPAECSPAR